MLSEVMKTLEPLLQQILNRYGQDVLWATADEVQAAPGKALSIILLQAMDGADLGKVQGAIQSVLADYPKIVDVTETLYRIAGPPPEAEEGDDDEEDGEEGEDGDDEDGEEDADEGEEDELFR